MSGFVSFLKQFGLDILKGIQIFEGIAPVAVTAAQAVGAISATQAGKIDTVVQMASAGLDIESNFTAAFGSANPTGAAKFAALVPRVQQIVLDSQLLTGKQVGNSALFTTAMQEYSQATVDLLNSLKPSISTSNSQNAPAIAPANLAVPPVVK